MRGRHLYLSLPVLAAALVLGGLAVAPSAAADCISSAGTTLCGQGSTRGSNTGEGPGTLSGPMVPYPCTYDWYCDDDNGFGITFGVW